MLLVSVAYAQFNLASYEKIRRYTTAFMLSFWLVEHYREIAREQKLLFKEQQNPTACNMPGSQRSSVAEMSKLQNRSRSTSRESRKQSSQRVVENTRILRSVNASARTSFEDICNIVTKGMIGLCG